MTGLLDILICHKVERYDYLKQLNAVLNPQIDNKKVRVLIDDSRYKNIGKKRNNLLARATGKYIAFVDDDDMISTNYVSLVMEGIKKDVDCCELVGIITDNYTNPRKFIHSLKYTSWFDKDGVYYRPPNHLNVIKREHAIQFQFPEKNHGEDHDWSMQIQKSGLLKTQHEINDVLYYYKCRDDEFERNELEQLRLINK